MRCTGYEMTRYNGTQASHLYEKSMHTLIVYNQWATAPGRSLNYPRPKSITHLRTFSDNSVYYGNYGIWPVTPGINTLLLLTGAWDLLHARGWLSWYTWDQRLYMVPKPRETHSPIFKARFLHLTNLVAQPEIKPQTFWLSGQQF